jgi:hypothetical protein
LKTKYIFELKIFEKRKRIRKRVKKVVEEEKWVRSQRSLRLDDVIDRKFVK